MSTPPNNICLAIETAVGAGSVAVLRDGVVVSETDRDDPRPSRAEHLLAVIDEVLNGSDVTLGDVTLLAVSTGPGSYSGIRIGVSTAIGLKNALGVVCRGVSVLEAIASIDPEPVIVAAVPVGKNDIAWQKFDGSTDLSEPSLVSRADFKTCIENMAPYSIRAPRVVFERIGYPDSSIAVDDKSTLAALIGKIAIDRPAGPDLKPIYLRSGAGF